MNKFITCANRLSFLTLLIPLGLTAQEKVEVRKSEKEKKIEVYVGQSLFTTFLYPDSLPKPVLFPIRDAAGQFVTRGFPLAPRPGEPEDHPHHTGLWLNYENVNGLDFWNNSYAIPAEKKSLYGWIKTDSILEVSDGRTGVIRYHAKWINPSGKKLLDETTKYEFSGNGNERWIDRLTIITADTTVRFADAKDGLLGLRLTRELQIPSQTDQHYTDNKGNISKVDKDSVATGNYLTSEGKTGDSAWSTRASWCMVYGKIGIDSVSVTIFDHPMNPNYPTFWHARGYGLFAANPLGENIFTKGKSSLNKKLEKGESLRLFYRIYIRNGEHIPSPAELDQIAKKFAAQK